MKKQLSVVIAALVLLAGCTVGPNYQRPKVTPPATFRGSEDTTTAASLADAKWFQVFQDEQLQKLIRTALEHNYDVQEAAARVEAERAVLGITRADQFPTVTASGSITNERLSRNGNFPLPPGVKQQYTFGTVGLNLLSYEVDAWGRLRRATEAARANLLASQENQQVVLMTLVSDLSTAYFNLLELDRELEVAKRTLGTREDSLRIIQRRQSRGLATMLDVRQAEQLVEGATETIPALEQRREQTENQISLLIGTSPEPIVRGQSLSDQQMPPAVPAGLPSSLLDRRPDIQSAEARLVAANAQIGVAKAAYFPQISLTGVFGFQSSQLSSLFTAGTKTWQFVPQVSEPIFTAGRIKSNIRLTEAQKQLAVVQYEHAIQNSFREVSDALVAYKKVREVGDTQEKLVATLQDRSRLAYRRYEGGVDTLLNAQDADRDLFAAELGLAQVKRDELVSVVQLYRALGGGWQE